MGVGTIHEGIKTFNSTVRTGILGVLVAGVGAAGFYGYSEYSKHERLLQDKEAELTSLRGTLEAKDVQIEQMGADLEEKQEQIVRLETAMALLKTDQRLAELRVIAVQRDEDGKAVTCELEFVELSPQGAPLSEPKRMTLPGDLVYIDNWIIKFDDQYIEQADIERGTSLCLFRRIFSEEQFPTQGYSLDEVGMRPQAYSRGGEISPFEQELWDEFWEFANDESKAADKGIRAAHGEAVAIKVREGKTYQIELRASGGLSIQPKDSEGPPRL